MNNNWMPLSRSLSRVYRLATVNVAHFGAMLRVKAGRPMIGPTLRVVSILGGRLNLSLVKVLVTYYSRLSTLARHNGLRYVVLYLKGCSTILMQSVGGHRLNDLTPLGVRVSRTRGGAIPRIIPALHRARIRRGEIWVIRLWVTLFGLYRVIQVLGILKLQTITQPSTMQSTLLGEFSDFLSGFFLNVLKHKFESAQLMRALWEGPGEFLAGLRASPFLISKSTPSARLDRTLAPQGTESWLSTSPIAIIIAAHLWLGSPTVHALFAWAQITGNSWVPNRMRDWTEGFSPENLANPIKLVESTLGVLGIKLESAGKVRVFAIVDCWTQWVLKPLHDAVFELLRIIPQDGTFDQLAPLERLLERLPKGTPIFSYDLSAATDRLPLLFQKVLMSFFLTSWGAECLGQILVGRAFRVPSMPPGVENPDPATHVHYECGQPIGALCSWALLAFTHHVIIQWAAFRAGYHQHELDWFEDYAVLGDDVIIGNKKVAAEYVALMDLLGVQIGLHKSLVSPKGRALEFAKRFFAYAQNASPAPFLEFFSGISSLSALVELSRKYELTLGQYLSAVGYGYKSKRLATGRLISLPSRLRNYLLAYFSPAGVRPLKVSEFFAFKSVGNFYSSTEAKMAALILAFNTGQINLLIKILDKLEPLRKQCLILGTVYRDREHYGTAVRDHSRKLQIGGFATIKPWPQKWGVLDALRENVYRPAFLDTAIELRDLRTILEGQLEGGTTLTSLEDLYSSLQEIERMIAHLPLPTDIDTRRDQVLSDLRFMSKTVESWYVYSSSMRSTRST